MTDPPAAPRGRTAFDRLAEWLSLAAALADLRELQGGEHAAEPVVQLRDAGRIEEEI
jgi:hypothetical protein